MPNSSFFLTASFKSLSEMWQILAGLLFTLVMARSHFSPSPFEVLDVQDADKAFTLRKPDVKVPVTLGVMSRCPDALICEAVFDKVVTKIGDKIELSLSFIGKLNDSEKDFGVSCMHGPDECAGNVQELCAFKYLPQQQWWSYVQCQNYNGRDKIGTPDVALSCANTAKFSWEESGVGECAGPSGDGKGEEGVELLKESVQTSELLGITKSCTVLINAEKVCVHDETWKECDNGHTPEDFIRQINDEYDKLNRHSH